ncbi:MAG: hypothetical protein KGZ97_05170 [Bacteroidetes bacterium]|nr:hypothetical protein [Bacteroidota bacterium]
MSENYLSLKEKLTSILRNTNSGNFKENKSLLIQLRGTTHSADLSFDQKKEINALFDEAFEKVNSLFDKEKSEFEAESEKNFHILAPKINEALIQSKYAEEDDLNDAWNYCIQIQQEFKGIKMIKEVRESLYSQLQQAFDIIKEKRDLQKNDLEKKSVVLKNNLLPEIEALVLKTETANNLNELWEELMASQQKVRASNLSYDVRNQLLSKLQEGFTILKIRKDEEKSVYENTAKDNVSIVEELVNQAFEIANNTDNFKEGFEKLKEIQQSFRDYKLLAEDREALYSKLQSAFETIKQRQNDFFNTKNKEAIENYGRLKPIVEAAYERAQTSMEFKKTKEHLIRVQSEFKGIKMNADERQALYSKLQSAFEILHKRQDDYYAAKKDKIELHVNYQISDIDLRIEAVRKDIDKDMLTIQNLTESDNNPLNDNTDDPSHDINNHIQLLKAAIARKEEELSEFNEMRENLLKKKNKWEEID